MLVLWDLHNALRLGELPQAHTGPVTGIAILPEGRAISAARDGRMAVWDLHTQSALTRLSLDVPITCMTAVSGALFAVGDSEGAVYTVELVGSWDAVEGPAPADPHSSPGSAENDDDQG